MWNYFGRTWLVDSEEIFDVGKFDVHGDSRDVE